MGQHIGAAIPMKDSDGFIVAGYDGLYTLENGEKKLLYRLDKELKALMLKEKRQQDKKQ